LACRLKEEADESPNVSHICFSSCYYRGSCSNIAERRTTQETTPISGIDKAAYAGSARASKLIGSKVYKGDTSIGSIEDVLVNLDDARVSAVILSVGGFLGMGDKLVAIPVNQLKVGSEAKFAPI
jgi:sporulation protein YlmC with PRC-barrel domain